MIIYLATNTVNGMQYVGQTKQVLNIRAAQHRQAAKRKCSPLSLACAIKEYGADKIVFEQIDSADTEEELTRKEALWIERLNTKSPQGYNLQKMGNQRYEGIHIPENIFEFEGKWFASIAQWARHYDISVHVVRGRLRSGMTLEQIKLTPIRPHKVAIDVGFAKFESWREACKHFGLCDKVVWARVKSGWTTREALGIDQRDETKGDLIRRKRCVWKIKKDGVTYYGKAEIAKAFGIEKACLQSRLMRGIPLKEAVMQKNLYEIEFDGKVYASVAALAKQRGITPNSVYDRMYRGVSLARAVEMAEEMKNAKNKLTQQGAV